jgi:CRP-like cAMP-binding protein
VDAGQALITQGEMATDVYLVLDGILVVEVDGREVAEIGPGAVVGERAAREGGVRTATLRAVTRVRAAKTAAEVLDATDLGTVAATHHREDAPVG